MRAHEIIEALVEAVVPATNYGYWVTTDCRVIPVHYEGHDDVAQENGFSDGYPAMKAGWLRVVARRGSFACEAHAFTYSARQVLALKSIISAADYSEFHLDLDGQPPQHKSFARAGGLINTLQQAVKRFS